MHPPLADAAPSSTTAADDRPDFLVRLGLLLPCSVADVEAAYRDRAKQAHPDAGGTTADFIQLHADYEAALQYARFRSSRRGWLAATIERYAAQQEVVAEIERRGGSIETERNEWIARQIGDDFAQVLDTVVGVRLGGPTVGLADVQYLASQQQSLAGLKRLDLSASRIGNTALEYLTRFSTLHELDLSGTFVGNPGVALLREMPALRCVNLAHTFVGWWGILQLRRGRPDLQVATCCEKGHFAEATKRTYRLTARLLLLYVVALLIATHVPIEQELPTLGPWVSFDKLVHVGIYAGMSCLAAFVIALRSCERTSRTGLSVPQYLVIAVAIGLFAAADETTQPLTGRQLDFKDWIADLAGIGIGLVFFSVIQIFWHRRQVSTRRSAQQTVSSFG
jgi:VanZ family protein